MAGLLEATGTPSTLVVVETIGDRRTDLPLEQLGGQGVFVKEVQAAVVRGEADAAVHSAKDLPSSVELSVPDLVLAAMPERGDPRDVLVGGGLDSLPTGSVVATGSARRRVQLANLRPDLTFTGLRGNLATRLATVGVGDVAAVVVAKAAIDRLDWSPPEGLVVEVLAPELMVPQVGQGALAIECRADDARHPSRPGRHPRRPGGTAGDGGAGLPGRAGRGVHVARRSPRRVDRSRLLRSPAHRDDGVGDGVVVVRRHRRGTRARPAGPVHGPVPAGRGRGP